MQISDRNSEKTNGSPITASTQMTKYENHSIYARWTANTYTVAIAEQ